MRNHHTRSSPMRPLMARGAAQLNWIIWWDTQRRPGGDGRSRAMEANEEDALQRAERFLRLGFVVYAINDPKGAMFMDEAQITDHFAERERLAAAGVGPDKPLR